MEVFRTTCVALFCLLVVCYPRQAQGTAEVEKAGTGNENKSAVVDSEPAGSGKKFTIGMEDDDLDGFSKKYGKKGE